MSDNITLPREVVERVETLMKIANKWSDDVDILASTVVDLRDDLTELRTALAAEPTKPKEKEKAVFWQERFLFPHSGEWSCWYFCRPRMAHQPLEQQRTCGTRYEYRALYAAPPENEALRRDAERLTDEQIDSATSKERDDLLDHIYEYGTAAEGILERIRKLARAAINAEKEDKT